MKCVSCKSENLKLLRKHEEYELYECSCFMQFWYPFTNPGHSYYEEKKRYVEINKNPYSKPLFPSQKLFLRTLPNKGGRLIDVGCGAGRFLAEARNNYKVKGFDFDESAVKTARAIFNVDVFVADASYVLEEKFDVITMFEVLEHLDNHNLLDNIRKFLTPGGVLVLSTPWRESWGVFLKHDIPPHHLTKWNERSIINFLEFRGLEVIKIKLIPVVFHRFIMRFNDWTKGWLSFSTVNKTEKALNLLKPKINHKPVPPKVGLLQMLSFAKLYGLFLIPALILYFYLWLTGRRNCTDMYVVAKFKAD